MNELIIIGYWRTEKDNFIDENSQFPWPAEYIQPEWCEKIVQQISYRQHISGQQLKQIVIDYLNYFKKINHYMGSSVCRVCNIRNGSAERSDREFLWPEGYSHYIKQHNVIPSIKLINNALKWENEKKMNNIDKTLGEIE